MGGVNSGQVFFLDGFGYYSLLGGAVKRLSALLSVIAIRFPANIKENQYAWYEGLGVTHTGFRASKGAGIPGYLPRGFYSDGFLIDTQAIGQVFLRKG